MSAVAANAAQTGSAEKKETPGVLARRWWRHLQDTDEKGNSKPGDRATRAQLRRADFIEAMSHEATFVLFRALGFDRKRLPRVAVLAGVLAHVRKDDGSRRFGQAIGRPHLVDAGSVVLSELRFKRLLACDDEAEILRGFRRVVALLGDKVNVADLARVILSFHREETRRDLAFDYYGASLAQPSRPADEPAAPPAAPPP